jgi:hypothetical protein
MGIKFLQHTAKRFGNQQHRIQEGKQSGQLTQKEAAKLEKKEQRLQNIIARDMFDGGGLSAREKNKIDRLQDKLSNSIYKQKHDKQTNATPVVDKRSDRLESRIAKGVESGSLNEREAARLSNGLSELEQATTAAKADGKVTKRERRELQTLANELSFRVAVQKHDRQTND